MNVLVDLRALQSGNVSGVEIYSHELTKTLCRNFPEIRFFLWTNSHTPISKNFPDFPFSNAVRVHTEYSNSLLAVAAAFSRRPKIDLLVQKKLQSDGVFTADDSFEAVLVLDPRPTPVSKKCRKITIFHDLAPLHFARSFSTKTRIWHHLIRLKKEARESAHILTPSRSTKDDLGKHFHIPEEKITVIGAGVPEHLRPIADPMELQNVREKYGLPHDFFLTLCTLEPRKNLRTLIEAFHRFRKKTQDSEVALVIAGLKNSDIFAKEELPQNPAVIFPGFIAEEDKAALYSASLAFIFPSLFEGFGLPVLEAMACGVPVIASNFSSLPEVYGDAAFPFNPTQTSEITDAMETVILRQDLREELARKGFERAHSPQFSWNTVAEMVMEQISHL